MGKFQDLTEQKFGRLIVIKKVENIKDRTAWLCKCECGNLIKATGRSLKGESTKSCGCLQREKAKEINLKHGKRQHKLYATWQNIKSRCFNKNNKSYKFYGDRGIKVYEEWKDNFESFYVWAINNGYKENLSIDRIDNNGNYEPKNCRWVDRKIQGRNKRNNYQITYKNETHCLSEWAEITGILRTTIKRRYEDKWKLKDVFATKDYRATTNKISRSGIKIEYINENS